MITKTSRAQDQIAAAPAKFSATDLISIADLGPGGVRTVLDLAAIVKARPADFRTALADKQLVLIFEKPSLRTRLTFESAMAGLGGVSFFIDQRGERLGKREPIRDVARNLERWVNGVVIRTFEHSVVTEMAKWAEIPVVNALTDLEHPCQALADYQTLEEKFGDVKKIKVAFVGDGNNVAHSLMLTAACLGSSIAVATPKGYEPDKRVLSQALGIAAGTGAKIEVMHDANAAVRNADAIYTDVWASMGQESQAAERARLFQPYQVNDALVDKAQVHALFMHCLPAHRGDEVTDGVIESPRSVVFDQAENRLHAQKSMLLLLLGGGKVSLPGRNHNG
jgi:ornithine carbamoyltransferase